MPDTRRNQGRPKPDRERALTLLASSPVGATETMLLAHGFTCPSTPRRPDSCAGRASSVSADCGRAFAENESGGLSRRPGRATF